MPQNSDGSMSQLKDIAHRAMLDNGLQPDYPPEVTAQVRGVGGPASAASADIRDLRSLLW